MNEYKSRLGVVLGAVAGAGVMLVGLLVVWMLAAGAHAPSAAAQSGDGSLAANDRPHIAVTGTGIVSAQPDILRLQVGVEIQDPALSNAQAQAATASDAILTTLKNSGVMTDDISTASYNIEPVTTQKDNEAPTVTGFRVTNIFNVTLRDIANAGKTIDALVASGANRIYGLTFDFSDPTAVVAQARTAAMNDAKAKAQQLATLGGVSLGQPLLIEEQSGTIVPVRQAVNAPAAAPAPSTAIVAGSQQVTVQVSVVYGLQ